MAIAIITEYKDVVNVNGTIPVPMEPAVANQSVTYAAATSSAAFNAATKFVRIICDADAHVVFGVAPTATASVQRLEANVEYFRGVIPGQVVSIYDGTS